MIEYIIGGGLVWLLCLVGGGNASEEEEILTQDRRNRGSLSSPYDDELLDEFEYLAENLAPSDEYISDAQKTATEIVEHLTEGVESCEVDVEIVRAKIAGSIGKKTCISYMSRQGNYVNPDLDLVVFVNDMESPFTELLSFFADLLRELDVVSDITVRKYSVQFKIWTSSHGDIKVDLLAAENFVKKSYPWRNEDVGEVEALVALRDLDMKQKEAIFRTRNVSQQENKLFCSSFAEKTVQVISDLVEDDFVLKVVRLAKYWNNTIDLQKYGYVPARSCVMELIAIVAQRTKTGGTQGRERCVISGFRRFLENVSKFSSLDISLEKDNQQDNLKSYTKPMVRDPVNNWNNLAEGIPKEVIKIWEVQAKQTLLLLEDLRNCSGSSELHENAIDKIFCHKPENNNAQVTDN